MNVLCVAVIQEYSIPSSFYLFIYLFPFALCSYLPFFNWFILYTTEEVQVLCICGLKRWKQQVLLNVQCTWGGLHADWLQLFTWWAFIVWSSLPILFYFLPCICKSLIPWLEPMISESHCSNSNLLTQAPLWLTWIEFVLKRMK